jgi:hypothetical protein
LRLGTGDCGQVACQFGRKRAHPQPLRDTQRGLGVVPTQADMQTIDFRVSRVAQPERLPERAAI